MGHFTNPILPGCYPDPSACRVGDEYFLVTSTFEYFPALPIFRSTDLVNWEQLGHAIDRESQLDLSSVPSSGGLFAPTIRHHDGTFYIINTLVNGHGKQGNFIVTAQDAAGPWSDPVWLDDAPGIDPSLLFDDGRAWYCGTRLAEPGLWEGQTDVWLREFDLDTLQLTGPEFWLWRGALVGARWAEGPHIYRIDGRYYLLAAEGGTAREHAISIAVSDSVTGPYVGNPANPVLTHRNLGSAAPIANVGHAVLVDTPAGDWGAVLLATRIVDGTESLLGRETNLVPVTWEGGWPVFAPGIAQIEAVVSGPSPQTGDPIARDDFDSPALGFDWNLVRTTTDARYSLDARPGWLRLPLSGVSLSEVGTPAFVGRRLQHTRASVAALVDFAPAAPTDWAGLAIRQSEDAHLVLALACDGEGGRRIVAVRHEGGVDSILAEHPVPAGGVTLGIRVDGPDCTLEYSVGGETTTLATTSTRYLASEAAGGFIGVWVGMFATSKGTDSAAVAGQLDTSGNSSTNHADFDWFDYRDLAHSL